MMTPSLTWIIRTFVPILVGFLVSLGVKYGFHLNSASVTVYVTAAVVAGYAALARFVEVKYPSIGKYLVSFGLVTAQPVYVAPTSIPIIKAAAATLDPKS
jgi:hypothetical protein